MAGWSAQLKGRIAQTPATLDLDIHTDGSVVYDAHGANLSAILSVTAGWPTAIAELPTVDYRHGLSVADAACQLGDPGCGTTATQPFCRATGCLAVAGRLWAEGLPQTVEYDPAASRIDIGQFVPGASGLPLQVHAQLDHLLQLPVDAMVSLDIPSGPIDVTIEDLVFGALSDDDDSPIRVVGTVAGSQPIGDLHAVGTIQADGQLLTSDVGFDLAVTDAGTKLVLDATIGQQYGIHVESQPGGVSSLRLQGDTGIGHDTAFAVAHLDQLPTQADLCVRVASDPYTGPELPEKTDPCKAFQDAANDPQAALPLLQYEASGSTLDGSVLIAGSLASSNDDFTFGTGYAEAGFTNVAAQVTTAVDEDDGVKSMAITSTPSTDELWVNGGMHLSTNGLQNYRIHDEQDGGDDALEVVVDLDLDLELALNGVRFLATDVGRLQIDYAVPPVFGFDGNYGTMDLAIAEATTIIDELDLNFEIKSAPSYLRWLKTSGSVDLGAGQYDGVELHHLTDEPGEFAQIQFGPLHCRSLQLRPTLQQVIADGDQLTMTGGLPLDIVWLNPSFNGVGLYSETVGRLAGGMLLSPYRGAAKFSVAAC